MGLLFSVWPVEHSNAIAWAIPFYKLNFVSIFGTINMFIFL